MNEHDLRRRLEAAVADVHPVSRLDEVTAADRSAQPPRRPRVLAVAAVLVLLVLAGAAIVQLSADDDPATTVRVQNDSSTTTAPEAPRVGQAVSVSERALPDGVHLIDESPRRTGADTVLLRFALDDGLWNGAGPYVRIVADRAPGLASQWAAARTGAPNATVRGHDAYVSTESSGGMPVTTTPGVSPPPDLWVVVEWSTGPDELVRVQGKGVDLDDLLALAQTVQLHR